jgi:hypothetical protein
MCRGCREDARVWLGLCGAVDSWQMGGGYKERMRGADRRSARRGMCAVWHGWVAPVRGLRLNSVIGSGLGLRLSVWLVCGVVCVLAAGRGVVGDSLDRGLCCVQPVRGVLRFRVPLRAAGDLAGLPGRSEGGRVCGSGCDVAAVRMRGCGWGCAGRSIHG